jgi:signal transduction histidine kinase
LRLLSAADDQRIALAQQLARGAGASLLELGPLLDAVPAAADPAIRAAVDRSRARSKGLVAGLRSLAAGLGPADLRTTGLEDSLSRLGAGFEGRLDLDVNAPDLPDGLAAATYFICAESITNAVKHAAATEVCVKVERRADRVMISIVDDGAGGASIEAGSGLRGLADRASALGGSLVIDSPPDGGTRVSVDLPVP